MTIIIIGISFILIWLGTTFFIVRYIKNLKSDMRKMFSNKEKSSDKNVGYMPEINDEGCVKPFDFIKHIADLNNLIFFIQYEHPQVIALVLSHLEPSKASVILQNLPQEIQSDVTRRIATMDRAPPEIIREIERVLEKKLSTLSSNDYFAPGGVENVIEILNLVGRDSEEQIIKALEEEDTKLAEYLKSVKTLKKPFNKILGKLKALHIEKT